MTACPARIGLAVRPPIPPPWRAPWRCPVPAGVPVAAEADAAALVVREAVALKLEGHNPVITWENGPRLVRLAEQMIDAFGIGTGRETEDDND